MTVKTSATGRPIAREHLAALRDALDSATLYETLSTLESNPRLAEVYRRLAGFFVRRAPFLAALPLLHSSQM